MFREYRMRSIQSLLRGPVTRAVKLHGFTAATRACHSRCEATRVYRCYAGLSLAL